MKTSVGDGRVIFEAIPSENIPEEGEEQGQKEENGGKKEERDKKDETVL